MKRRMRNYRGRRIATIGVGYAGKPGGGGGGASTAGQAIGLLLVLTKAS